MKQRLVIKGSLITYGQKWYFGEEIFSSVLLSASENWISKNYTPQGEFINELESWKRRSYGKIRASINAFVSDLHGISINYSLLKKLFEDQEIDSHKRNLFIEQLLEQYFTVIRSLYDHMTGIIKIGLTDKSLRMLLDIDSLNKLVSFSQNEKNKEKLPQRIRQFLTYIEPDLMDIRKIRDSIIHKGKEILVRNNDGGLFIRIPKTGPYSNDTILPNILKSNCFEYPMESYLREITKTLLKNSEDLGVIILSEMLERESFNWSLHSITNYCMEDFTEFILGY